MPKGVKSDSECAVSQANWARRLVDHVIWILCSFAVPFLRPCLLRIRVKGVAP